MEFRNRLSLAFAAVLLICAVSVSGKNDCAPAGDTCELPDCLCPDWEAPGGLNPETEVPQIVYLTFDDGVTVSNYPIYNETIFNRKNPNGAAISATFFVTHEYNNYELCHDMYRRGHELALHSITHKTDTNYWATMSETEWAAEVCDNKRQLAHFAKIPADEIVGFRVPFLQPGGDRQFAALTSAACDLKYDCSRATRFYAGPSPVKLWPYTMDFDPTFQDCLVEPCPRDLYPGFWTVPMVSMFGGNGFPCAMLDTCLPPPTTRQETFELLKRNFDNHYVTPGMGGIGNRAPFGLFTHAAYIQGEDNKGRLDGYIQFLDYLSDLDDVYIVSIAKALEWIKTPVPVANVATFPAWMDKTPPANGCAFAWDCAFTNDQTPFPGERYMKSCQPCPRNYPWLNNPLGAN